MNRSTKVTPIFPKISNRLHNVDCLQVFVASPYERTLKRLTTSGALKGRQGIAQGEALGTV